MNDATNTADRTYSRAELLTAIAAERYACSIAVWMTLQDALADGADDKGLDGWMREAEARVKNRLAHHGTEINLAPRTALTAPVAHVSECEACFTPEVCQLRGTCDHYSAERLRVAKQDADALAKFGDWTMLPLIATEPMQKAMQRAVMLRKSMNDVWMAGISEAPECPVSPLAGEPDWTDVREQAEAATGLKVERHTFSIIVREVRKWLAAQLAVA